MKLSTKYIVMISQEYYDEFWGEFDTLKEARVQFKECMGYGSTCGTGKTVYIAKVLKMEKRK